MIFAEPTKYGSGIFIFGHESDLISLHETIHELADEDLIAHQLVNLLLGLAYDIRKAFEGQREVRKIETVHHDNSIECFGVRILWPTFLLQIRLLRWVSGYQPTSKKQQSWLYLLESLTESAVIEYDPVVGKEVLECFEILGSFSEDYLVQFSWELTKEFTSYPNGKARFRKLPGLLRRMHSWSPEYRRFEELVLSAAAENSCSPHDMSADDDDELVFKW